MCGGLEKNSRGRQCVGGLEEKQQGSERVCGGLGEKQQG